MPGEELLVRHLGLCDYRTTHQAMQAFTSERDSTVPDRFWCLEHLPVYTLGMAGRPEHILDAGGIPVVKSDRGGQVTYHGPGQLVIYLLVGLQRRGLSVKGFVHSIEQSMIDMLTALGLDAVRHAGAPGVYIGGKKIGALGIRIRRGYSYHGLALNIDMDLTPFHHIHPCGYPGLETTRLRDFNIHMTTEEAAALLLPALYNNLNYDRTRIGIETEYDQPAVRRREGRRNCAQAVRP